MNNKVIKMSNVGLTLGVMVVVYICTLFIRGSINNNMVKFRKDTFQVIRSEREQYRDDLSALHRSLQAILTKFEDIDQKLLSLQSNSMDNASIFLKKKRRSVNWFRRRSNRCNNQSKYAF